MKITIKGYKNLKNLNFSIKDNSFNMIFGMTGSGKSSIAGALGEDGLEENKTVGFDGNQIIKINDKDILSNIKIFNQSTVEEYIFNKNDESAYDLFIDNKFEFKKAEKKLKKEIASLENELNNSKSQYEKLKIIKKEFGSSLTKDNKLKSSSSLVSLEKSLKKFKNNRIYNEISNLENGKFKWIKESETFNDKISCPFCNKKMSKSFVNKIEKFYAFEEKPLEKFMKNSGEFFSDIDVNLSGIEKMKKQVVSSILAIDDYDKITIFLNKIQNDVGYEDKIEKIVLSKDFKNFFPDLYVCANKVFNRLDIIKKIAGDAHKHTKTILSRKLSKINKRLNLMSIPYKLCANYANGRILDYKMVLINDPDELDRPFGLSNGEKNIVALLLFLLECKKDQPDLIILDDPVSAYDDYRRSQILKFIQADLSGLTIMLLSHDNIYAKYAVSNRFLRVGEILYFENFEEKINFKEVTKESFGNFDDFIIQRIKSTKDYYKKIINLRLLYEGRYSSIAYSYLSAIVHKTSNDDLHNLLAEKNLTEEEIIDSIKSKYPDLSNVDIPPYDDNFKFNIDEYSMLEKAFVLREKLGDNSKQLTDELNDFVHINGRLKVCLNPYEYNFCSKFLYETLNDKSNF